MLRRVVRSNSHALSNRRRISQRCGASPIRDIVAISVDGLFTEFAKPQFQPVR